MNALFAAVSEQISAGIASPQDILLSYGLPGVVILGMAAVIIYIDKDRKSIQKEKDRIQEARLEDMKAFTTSLKGPVEEQIELTKRLYDLVLNNTSRRGR